MEERKRRLRAAVREAVGRLDETTRAEASARAAAKLLDLPEVASARTVALFAATAGEVDPRAAAAGLVARAVTVLLPRVAGDELDLVAVRDLDTLRPGFRGILEPRGQAADIGDLDVVVVPGVAFDRGGGRLGRGGGHYDRLLARLPAASLRVGLCFAAQLVEAVPAAAHDEPVDLVVTDDEVVVTGARH